MFIAISRLIFNYGKETLISIILEIDAITIHVLKSKTPFFAFIFFKNDGEAL
jgi:hypothetical protein